MIFFFHVRALRLGLLHQRFLFAFYSLVLFCELLPFSVSACTLAKAASPTIVIARSSTEVFFVHSASEPTQTP